MEPRENTKKWLPLKYRVFRNFVNQDHLQKVNRKWDMKILQGNTGGNFEISF